MDDKVFNIILHEIAKENGYTLLRVIDNVYEFKKGNKSIYIRGKDFGLNTALSSSLAKNKAQTFEILRRNNIKAVPHYELYQPLKYALFGDQEKRNKKRIKAIIEKEKFPLVLKPAEGFHSDGVSVIYKKRKLKKQMRELFMTKGELVIAPFREIEHEYRTVVLNNKVELIFDKVKPTKTKKKIIRGVKSKIINPDSAEYKKIETLARRGAKALGLDFTTVDIIETKKEGLEILEINSKVCLCRFGNKSQKNYDIVKSIYKKAFKRATK